MRRVSITRVAMTLVLSACWTTGCGSDAEPLIEVKFQSKWFPQAQFAGYYVAGGHPENAAPSGSAPLVKGKNFYADEGLDVTVLPGGTVNPSESVALGTADFGTDWISNFLLRQEQSSLDLVHIAQIFQRPGFEMVALKTKNITDMAGFAGHKAGVWAFGSEFPAYACFKVHNLTYSETTGSDIETVVYAFDPALVFPDQVDIASAMVYNELNQIVGLGHALGTLDRFSAADNGCGLLEDFVFTTAEILNAANWKGSGKTGRDVAQRFVRATIKGWQYVVEQSNEATTLAVVLDVCGDTCRGSGSQTAKSHQSWQLARVRELVQPSLLGKPSVTVGCLNDSEYAATQQLLEDIGSITDGVGDTVVRKDILTAAGVNCP